MSRTHDDRIPLSRERSAGVAHDVEEDRRRRLIEIGTLAMFGIAAAATYRMWILGVTSVIVALTITVAACGLSLVWLRRGSTA